MATQAELKAELKKVRKDIAALEHDPEGFGMEYTQGIVDKLYSTYKAGKAWLDKVKNQSATRGWVVSPIGRRRSLYRVFTGARKFIADAARRAQNSPIQGVASEVGTAAGMLIVQAADEFRVHQGWAADDEFIDFCRVVHDACYYGAPFRYVIPMIHFITHEATYGVTDYYRQEFGWEFNVEPEIEIDIGSSDDTAESWDWSFPNLFVVIGKALKNSIKIGHIDSVADAVDAYETIVAPWRDKDTRKYLFTRWPLLGRSDLTKEMLAALNAFDIEAFLNAPDEVKK